MILKLNNLDNYLMLMRMNTLTGAWLLLFPSIWGLLMFSKTLYDLLWLPIFICGAVVMRSAGCIVNDIVDLSFDQKVERTKNRPLVLGKVTKTQAIILLLFLLFIGLLLLLPIVIFGSISALCLAFVVIIMVFIYPFAKRFTNFPQLILGGIFNVGDLFASIAINGFISLSSVVLYIGSAFWIIHYDIIYAHQDKKYDKKCGIGSMALTKFGEKSWLYNYCSLSILFWMVAGVLSQLGFLFYLSMCFVYWLLFAQIKQVDLESPEECMKSFKFNEKVGLMVAFAILLGKIKLS